MQRGTHTQVCSLPPRLHQAGWYISAGSPWSGHVCLDKHFMQMSFLLFSFLREGARKRNNTSQIDPFGCFSALRRGPWLLMFDWPNFPQHIISSHLQPRLLITSLWGEWMPLKVFVCLIPLSRSWTFLILLIKSDVSKYGNGTWTCLNWISKHLLDSSAIYIISLSGKIH